MGQDQDWVHCSCFQEEQGWQDREQEGERSGQGCSWPLGRSLSEGPQSSEHQGFLSYQEGHSTLQEGQGALLPVKAMSNLRRASRACSRCGAFYVCRAQEPML